MAKARKTRFDAIFDIVVTIICILALIIVLYPLYFCVIASISNPTSISNGKVILAPDDITFAGYKYIFRDSRILGGYLNTVIYALGSTFMGLVLTIPAGYALSRKDLYGRKFLLKFYVFTMYFSGGLIPTYILVRNLGLIDLRMTVVLMGSFSVYNLLVTRTFFSTTLPVELWEAAEIDGCSDWKYFCKVAVPLSSSIIAIIALFYCVTQWNDYMNSLIYLNTQSKYSLQMVLREVLLAGQDIVASAADPDEMLEANKTAQTIKYGAIIIAIVPMMVVYPFLQKFFVKGVMIGSIKG